MYNAIAGSCAEDKANAGGGGGGGGGSASVSVATTSSGNYDNAVKVGIWNNVNQDFGYSNGIEDGSNSTFGTASSPTRTTQSFDVAASDYLASYTSNGTSYSQVIIGGYIRNNNFTSANKHRWIVDSAALVSSTMSNGGASVSVNETKTEGKLIKITLQCLLVLLYLKEYIVVLGFFPVQVIIWLELLMVVVEVRQLYLPQEIILPLD